ncbi:MAG TPA: hypothetical protein VGP84_01915, partial [Gemmatimonadaceae bacterium]|nr:hypothetical protein [Gemmatimonadaceae bacterium]
MAGNRTADILRYAKRRRVHIGIRDPTAIRLSQYAAHDEVAKHVHDEKWIAFGVLVNEDAYMIKRPRVSGKASRQVRADVGLCEAGER